MLKKTELARTSLLTALLLAQVCPASPCPTRSGPATQDEEPKGVIRAATLAEAFADWKLAAATTAAPHESLAALRTLAARVESSTRTQPDSARLEGLAEEIGARLAALSPEDAQEPTKPARTRAEELVVAEAVVSAVRTGDLQLLVQLGPRAVPALASLAVSVDGTTIPQGELNPLESLFRLDVPAGLDATLVLMESGDVLKKGFAAATLEQNSKLNWDAAWEPVGATDWAFARESWARIVPAAFEEPALPSENLKSSISILVVRGQVPQALEDFTFESRLNLPEVRIPPESGRAFFVRLLGHRNWSVRERVARLLRRTRDLEATYRLATDPEYGVRKQLVAALQEHTVLEYSDRASSSYREVTVPTEMTDAYREAVLKLSRDEHPGLRADTVRAVTSNVQLQGKPLFSVEELREFLTGIDDVALLYQAVRQVSTLPATERVPMILFSMDLARALVEPGKPLGDEATALLSLDRYGLGTGPEFWAIVDGLSERGLLTEKFMLLQRIQHFAGELILAGKTSGTRYVEWAVRSGEPDSWNSASWKNNKTNEVLLAPWLEEASSAARALAVRELAKSHRRSLEELSGGHLAIAASDLLGLVRDGSAATLARTWASHEVVTQHPAAVTNDALAAVIEAFSLSDTRNGVAVLMNQLEPIGRQEEFLLGLIAAPNTDEALLHRLRVSTMNGAAAEAVLERFPPDTWADIETSTVISAAVGTLITATTESLDPRLEFANVRDSSIQEKLANAIGASRAPVLLPLLDRILANATPGSAAWNNAVQAVSGYFNDDAAALLLRAAREATGSEARQLAMNALKQMSDWREASAAWERSAGAAAKREVAIEELVALTEDGAQPVEVRAEALRGLGLLDAAEELPRLVRALTSKEAPIAEAARAALDRMNGDG